MEALPILLYHLSKKRILGVHYLELLQTRIAPSIAEQCAHENNGIIQLDQRSFFSSQTFSMGTFENECAF